VKEQKLLRILDANFNRTAEGLRVCEDIARFILDDRPLTKAFKNVRHDTLEAVKFFKLAELRSARNIEEDVGTQTIKHELKRKKISDIFFANIQRAKESLRVLEELAKLLSPKLSEKFKKLRYELYALEKKATLKL
jgi:hypothetical protein